jgi:hypothetical protein
MTSLGLALMSGSALAQTAKDIVGTWKQVTNINIASMELNIRIN